MWLYSQACVVNRNASRKAALKEDLTQSIEVVIATAMQVFAKMEIPPVVTVDGGGRRAGATELVFRNRACYFSPQRNRLTLRSLDHPRLPRKRQQLTPAHSALLLDKYMVCFSEYKIISLIN